MSSFPCWAVTAHACPGGVSISSFRLLVKPVKDGKPLPISAVNELEPGATIRYEPINLPDDLKKKAKVAIVLVPIQAAPNAKLQVLAEEPANAPTEWKVPMRASVVGLVFGEHGVDEKKVNSMVEKNPELINDLADYAEQTNKVEALVQTLANYEASTPGTRSLNSALRAFSAQYGVLMPKMDASTPADQQATAMLQAIVPQMSAANNSPTDLGVAAESTSLAASVGALYLGNPVTLAAGGAALMLSLHSSLFPATDFKPAYTQPAGSDGLNFCAANRTKKAHTRLAYLWMLRVPDAPAPKVTLSAPAHLEAGRDSPAKALCASVAQLKLLPRAREWQLTSGKTATVVPVKVVVGDAADTLNINLREAKIQPGEYKLQAMWDWSPMAIAGDVTVHSVPDFSKVKLTPESADKLITHSGTVSVQLAGADFEFLDSIGLETTEKHKTVSTPVPFTLPKGKAEGEQETVEADIDTSSLAPGTYSLQLKQANGSSTKLPITIHPPNPKFTDLPLRVNLGQPQQKLKLTGSWLERVEKITSANATWTLAPLEKGAHDVSQREVTVALDKSVQKGDMLTANLVVAGLNDPISVPDVAEVLGPRPQFMSVKNSFASQAVVQLRDSEIPAGAPVSFAMQVANVDARPSVTLKCGSDFDTKQPLTILAGAHAANASLEQAGEGVLFLSVDPGSVGQSGCELNAVIKTDTAGESDPYVLGRVVQLPYIQQFALTNERLSDGVYAGTLTGTNLQTIEKTGWDPNHGNPVQGIPTPVPSQTNQQQLKIAVPWPSPSPRAPLYIWLRGENEARATTVTY